MTKADNIDNANESPLLLQLKEDLKEAMRNKDAGKRDGDRDRFIMDGASDGAPCESNSGAAAIVARHGRVSRSVREERQ